MFLDRYRQLKRFARFRRVGVVLFAVGLVFAGMAFAPYLLEIQWRAGQFATEVKEVAERLTHEERAVGHLPQNEDKEDSIARADESSAQGRVKAFALVGAAHAAASSTPVAQAPVAQATVAAAGKVTPPATFKNRMVIPSIKVDMQIAEGMDEKVLNRGLAWKLPYVSTPDKGGNTVIGCHRYLYTSGSRTCFNLDKVKEGDELYVDWKGVRYYYSVREIKVVNPDEVSILYNTRAPVLTVFTCTPKFTSKFRLVVISDLIRTESI